MIRVLREAGFEVEALHELQPARRRPDAFQHVSLEWARSVAVGGDLGGAEALSYGVGVSSASAASTGGASAAASTRRSALESART